jgi:16S rRNA (uracil1498-N3)-methyltransferase
MPRFYCPQPLSVGLEIWLSGGIAHHLNVLRLNHGDNITLFNGEGGEYTATMAAIEKKKAMVVIKTFTPRESELPHALTLAQALPEASKMDWIIEKAVELGVTAIQPLAAQRCVVRLDAERAQKKAIHWEGIIASASEQCGRNRLAQLATPTEFQQWITQKDLHPRILLSPHAEQSLSDWCRHHSPQPVTLAIGPEGGFTQEEETAALAQGAIPLSMGSRILRTETAGLAAVAALNAIWGAI